MNETSETSEENVTVLKGCISLILIIPLVYIVFTTLSSILGISHWFEPKPSVELIDFSTNWYDRGIWVPGIKVTVKNTGNKDLHNYIIKVDFIDLNGTIASESKEWIKDIPAGRAKGPFSIRGNTGYKNFIALMNITSEGKFWSYDLYYSTNYNGPFTKIQSGHIDPLNQMSEK